MLCRPPYEVADFRGQRLSDWLPDDPSKAKVPARGSEEAIWALVRLWCSQAGDKPRSRRYWATLIDRAQPARPSSPPRLTRLDARPAATEPEARSSTPLAAFPRFAGVPPPVAHFVGREGDLDRLRDQVGDTNVAVVTGLGGVGKTALVTEFCHRLRQDFLLVRWIVASSREETMRGLVALASAMNVDTTRLSAEDAIRTAYEALGASAGRWLLVFDNVEKPGWISDLLPIEPNATVIITSRWRSWADEGLAAMALATLRRQDSVKLLTTITGYDTDKAATQLAVRLDGLSLAVRQAATYCAHRHYDFVAYLRLLDERAPKLYSREAALQAVLETSLESVSREAPLAGVILNICAHLPPTGIRAELFLDAYASNEPLLQHGDDVLVRDALSALEQYSLLERTLQEADGPVQFGVHRLIQQLCRATAGEQQEQYVQTALRLLRRAGAGWDYYVADSGVAVVGVERGTGRLLLTRTADGTRTQLPLPPDAVGLPLSVEVDDARVTARYADDTAVWTVDEHATGPPGPTHVVADALPAEELGQRQVRLADGRVMEVWGWAQLTVELEGSDNWTRELDPGWYSGNRRVVTPPLIDPTGQWLLVSMFTWKHEDHGWIAWWRVEDVLAGNGPEPLEGRPFWPNGPFVDEEDYDEDGRYSGAPVLDEDDPSFAELVTSMRFSADGTRLYLLDMYAIHAWSWPDRTLLWRVLRPELHVSTQVTEVGAGVRCCVSLSHPNAIRAALTDGRVVDIAPRDLRVTEVGHCAEPLAISPVDGSVLNAAPGLVQAFGIDDGSFICRTAEDQLVRVQTNGQITEVGWVTGEVLAVHRSGAAALVQDGEGFDIRRLAVVGDELRDVGSTVMCWTGEWDWELKRPMPTRAAFAAVDQPVIACGCTRAGHGDDVVTVHREPTPDQCRTEQLTSGLTHTYAVDQVVTAVAADGAFVAAGTADGTVTLWSNDGPESDGMRERFSTCVSAQPIRWILPLLDTRRIVAITEDGHVAVLEWG